MKPLEYFHTLDARESDKKALRNPESKEDDSFKDGSEFDLTRKNPTMIADIEQMPAKTSLYGHTDIGIFVGQLPYRNQSFITLPSQELLYIYLLLVINKLCVKPCHSPALLSLSLS